MVLLVIYFYADTYLPGMIVYHKFFFLSKMHINIKLCFTTVNILYITSRENYNTTG